MCGRFTLRSSRGIKVEGARNLDLPLEPRYNIAPSQKVLVAAHLGNGLDLRYLVWGLVPSWSKDGKGFINARSETIEDKPSFSESFQRRRCLIPADGFYEWQRSGKVAQPYFFQMRDESPFAFAGIWDEWQGDEKAIASCAIITTTANELVALIHDRMPVILPSESQDKWLDDESELGTLRNLLAPFPASEMTTHAVSYDVNHPKIDDEYLTRPIEPNIGVTLSLF
jgi:putative SOS response-associated peptidase YedK